MKRARALLLSALVSWSAPAFADEYDAAFTRAIAAKERALDTNDPASWQAAIDLFAEADRIRATKESKYELGAAAARLKQDDIAVEAFEAALGLGLEGAAADKARAFVTEHARVMGRVDVRGPDGAEIWIAARWRGTLPLGKPLVVFAGKRRVELRAGGDREQREIVVTSGAPALADFSAGPGAGAPAPMPPPALPPGPEAPKPAPAAADGSLAWTLTIGGASLVVLGGASALIAGSNVAAHRDRLADLCAVPSGSDSCTSAKPGQKVAAQDEVDSIATWKAVRTGGWVGLGAGVLATGVGIVLLIGSKEPKPQRTTLTFVPGWGGGALRGSF